MPTRKKAPAANSPARRKRTWLGTGAKAARRCEIVSCVIIAPSHRFSAIEAAVKQCGPDVIVRKGSKTVFWHEDERTKPNAITLRKLSDLPVDEVATAVLAQEFAARRKLLKSSISVDEAAELIGVRSRQTLHNWMGQGRIIALFDNGKFLLPVWQFDAGSDDKLVPGFEETLRALKRSSYSAAHWFTHPNVQLGNRAPIALLRAGRIEKVLAEAKSADVVS